MRERETRSQRASARTTAASSTVGGPARSDDMAARGSRNGAQHRTKRPPPLPTRKAHKIKRIKAQRSTPWAALEPAQHVARDQVWREHTGSAQGRGKSSASPNPNKLARPEERKVAGSPALAPGQPGAFKEREERIASNEHVAEGDTGSNPRWLLLLKVGKDDLAGIWDGSLASCEPIVWRPATKTWAPLFEVPQIATLVSATVRERQIVARSSAVPASPAPRRHQAPNQRARVSRPSIPPSEVPTAVKHPPALQNQAALQHHAVMHEPPRDAPQEPLGSARQPGSWAEIASGDPTVLPAARLALRSPYIPPPPRVPQGLSQSSGLPEVPSAFPDDEPSSATVPAFALAPRRISVEEPRFHPVAEDVASPGQLPPEPRAYLALEPMVREAEPSRASDSYAPQAHTIAPIGEPQRQGSAYERAAWLLAGVAAALTLTTFTGLGTSLRQGMASRLQSESGAVLSTVASRTADSRPDANDPAKGAGTSETKADQSESKDAAGEALSVEELPVLGRGAQVHASKAESSRGNESRRDTASERAVSSSGKLAAAGPGSSKAAAPRRPARQPVNAGSGFDAAAARRALASSVAKAQYCAAERATGTVVITFSPAGGVVSASLASLQGGDVRQGCVVRAFRGARITPFQGEPVTVQKSFRLR